MLEEFRVTVTVNGYIDKVWEKLVDWKSQGEWMALTEVNSSVDNGGASGVGTEISAFTGIGKFGVLDKMRVTQWEPPEFCAVDHYGKWIKGVGEFRLTQISPDKVRFDWYEKIAAPKLVMALVKPGIILAVTYSLRKFARSCATS
ncbi:MAG: SRPBCC family protein [Candidatus Nanopelagicaceae bacterium]